MIVRRAPPHKPQDVQPVAPLLAPKRRASRLFSDLIRQSIAPEAVTPAEEQGLRDYIHHVVETKMQGLREALGAGDHARAANIAEDITRQRSVRLWATYQRWKRIDLGERLSLLDDIDPYAPPHRIRWKRRRKRSGGFRYTVVYSKIDRARQDVMIAALAGSAVDLPTVSWTKACELFAEAVNDAPAASHCATLDVTDHYGSVSHAYVLALVPHVPAAALRATLLTAYPRADLLGGLEGEGDQQENGSHEMPNAIHVYGDRYRPAGARGHEPQILEVRGTPLVGLPQGNALSGLFAEAALREAMTALPFWVRWGRYADDLWIIVRDAEETFRAVEATRQVLLEARGGPFQCRPTLQGHLDCVSYLGYRFHKRRDGVDAEPDPVRREHFELRLQAKLLHGEDAPAALNSYLAAFYLWRGPDRDEWARAWSDLVASNRMPFRDAA